MKLFMDNVNMAKMKYKGINFLVLLGLLFGAIACQKDKLLTYEHPANVYLELSSAQKDSIVYTFAYDMTKAVDTVFIPVRLMGHRVDSERFYQAFIEQDSSTAQEDVHYKALEESYSLGAGEGKTSLPLIVYNTADLESQPVNMVIKLKSSEDFGVENDKIIRAYVVLSAQLEQPAWWSMWMGAYSRVKHQLFLLVTDQRELSMDGLDAPKNLYFADLLTHMLNDPFQWVEDHPEKGYVLTEDSGGYLFYHQDNPARMIHLVRNAGSGKYFFIDELGKEVR